MPLPTSALGANVDARLRAAAPANRIPELDGLRGLAILLVIICHYVANADHEALGFWVHRALSAFTIGWSGVDLFFVLSGFLIGGILLDARSSPTYFRAFYMRRVFRILPLYYTWTLLFGGFVAFALWLVPGRFPLSNADLVQVPIHLLFLQNIWIGMPAWSWIWFVVTWSLAVEEQFYLIIPFLIRFTSTRILVPVLAGIVVLAPFVRLAIFRITHDPFAASYPMPARADALSCGILLAIAWRQPGFHSFVDQRRRQLRRILLFLLLGVAILLWWLAHPIGLVTLTIGYSWLAFFYSSLLLFVLSDKTSGFTAIMRWSWLRSLGIISYCVYIIHDAINQIAHRLLLHASPQLNDARGVAVTLLSLAVTLCVAALSWVFIESPLIRRGHAYAYSTAQISSSPTLAHQPVTPLPASTDPSIQRPTTH